MAPVDWLCIVISYEEQFIFTIRGKIAVRVVPAQIGRLESNTQERDRFSLE